MAKVDRFVQDIHRNDMSSLVPEQNVHRLDRRDGCFNSTDHGSSGDVFGGWSFLWGGLCARGVDMDVCSSTSLLWSPQLLCPVIWGRVEGGG